MVATTRPNESKTKKEYSFSANRNHVRAGGDYIYNRKKDNSGFKKKSIYKGSYEDMDEDYPKNGVRMHKSKDQVKSKLPPDQQPDKYETMKRIEREKKAIQKKQLDEDYDRRENSMKRIKTNKTNWTKHYQTGMLDEEDFRE